MTAQYTAVLLQKLANKCKFKEEALHGRFVCGKFPTLEDLVILLQKVYQMAQSLELAQAMACELQASSRTACLA